MIFKLKDSSGQESTTLFFVTIGWIVLTLKFALAGVSFKVLGADIAVPAMTATEYGMSFAGIVGIWLGHDWIKKPKD